MTGVEGFLYISRELDAIFYSLLGDFARGAQATLKVVNGDEDADFDGLCEYFVGRRFGRLESRRLWDLVMEYRSTLHDQFGQKVSAHISFYYFTRDAEAREMFERGTTLRCAPTARRIAFLEMRSWWERNSETGLVREDLMRTRLEKELSSAARNLSSLSYLLISFRNIRPRREGDKKAKTGNPASVRQCRQETLQDLSELVMTVSRSSDIVGHARDGHLAVIMPRTDQSGALALARRLNKALACAETPCSFDFRMAVSSAPKDASAAKDLMALSDHALRGGLMQEPGIFLVRLRRGSAGRLLHLKVISPLRRFAAQPVAAAMLAVLLFAAWWFHGSAASIFTIDESWRKITGMRANIDGKVPGWVWIRGRSPEPFSIREPRFHKGNLLLMKGGGERMLIRKRLEGKTMLHLQFQAPLNSRLRLSLVGHSGEPVLLALLERESLELSAPPFLLCREDLFPIGRWTCDFVLVLDGTRIAWGLNGGKMSETLLPGRLPPVSHLQIENAREGCLRLYNLEIEQSNKDTEFAEPKPSLIESHSRMKEALRKLDAGSVFGSFEAMNAIAGKAGAYRELLVGDLEAQLEEKEGDEKFFRSFGAFLRDLAGMLCAAGVDIDFSELLSRLQDGLGSDEARRIADAMIGIPGVSDRQKSLLFSLLVREAAEAGKLFPLLARARASVRPVALAEVLEAALKKTALMPADEAGRLWEEYFALEDLIRPSRLFASSLRYLEWRTRADATPELERRAVLAALRNWREDPEGCYRFMRGWLEELPAGEATELMKDAGLKVERNVVHGLLLGFCLLRESPSAARNVKMLINQFEDMVKETAVLLPEFLVMDSCVKFGLGRMKQCEENLKRLEEMNDDPYSSWAVDGLLALQNGKPLPPMPAGPGR